MDIFKTMKNGNIVNLSRPKGIGSSVLKGGLSAGKIGVSGVRSFNQYRVKQKEIGNARQQFYFVWLNLKQDLERQVHFYQLLWSIQKKYSCGFFH